MDTHTYEVTEKEMVETHQLRIMGSAGQRDRRMDVES